MDRRGFLKWFSAGVAGIALEQAIPLGRVWSFPSKIVLPQNPVLLCNFLPITWYTRESLYQLFKRTYELDGTVRVGSNILIRFPQRYKTTITLDQVRGVDIELIQAVPLAPRQSSTENLP
jgi:hypothetical protein